MTIFWRLAEELLFLQKGNKSFLGRKKMGGKSGKFNYWSERF